MKIVIQLGSTRDGLELYKERAKSHKMECILIETPEYLKLREELGRQKFTKTIAVNHPANADEVIQSLKEEKLMPHAIIAGFERYNYAAYDVAKKLNILPYDKNNQFKPLTKIDQRNALKNIDSSVILQPQYLLLKSNEIIPDEFAHMKYPLVIKPIDGGGGLGTFIVRDYPALTKALEQLKNIKNYDGGEFTGIMIEEFISGHEYSVQGFVREGKITILSYGKKFIFTDDAGTDNKNMNVFRESGLIAISGANISKKIKEFTEICVKAFHYKNGAFHIDMKETKHGYYFLEMGFRVSGFGITKLTEQISGYNWAEETFSSLLKIQSNTPRKEVSHQ